MAWLISKALYESWLCSQEEEGESLEDTYSDGEPSAQSSGSHTQLAYLLPDKMTAFSRLSRFGMTFKPLTADRGADLLMWFRGDFLARTYPQQERVPELKEADQVCGSRWQELSVKYDLDSHSWRTHLCLWDEALQWSSVTLPKWGMTRNGALFQHPTAERPISGTGSGLWLTPSASEDAAGTPNGKMQKMLGNDPRIRGTTPEEWGRGTLNPSWVEWLMGWPLGWTDLKPLEMVKFQSWLQQHGEY
jgi:hypothetical protein